VKPRDIARALIAAGWLAGMALILAGWPPWAALAAGPVAATGAAAAYLRWGVRARAWLRGTWTALRLRTRPRKTGDALERA
jgi:hypothetical protein